MGITTETLLSLITEELAKFKVSLSEAQQKDLETKLTEKFYKNGEELFSLEEFNSMFKKFIINYIPANTLKLPQSEFLSEHLTKMTESEEVDELDMVSAEETLNSLITEGVNEPEMVSVEDYNNLMQQLEETQLFSGKLVLLTKILMGKNTLSSEEKQKLCMDFDSAETYEEAHKIYKAYVEQ